MNTVGGIEFCEHLETVGAGQGELRWNCFGAHVLKNSCRQGRADNLVFCFNSFAHSAFWALNAGQHLS